MPKKKKARPVEEKVAARLLADNRHCCCICCEQGVGKPVQIHHIDENPSNNDPANLCVLCKPHHDEVHSKPYFAREYLPYELEIYKKRWEKHCNLENKKVTVIKHYYILSDKESLLDDPKIKYPFLADVSGGTSVYAINLIVNSTGEKVEDISHGALSAEEFTEMVLKGSNHSEEE